jgi:hypothetical protein
VRREKPCRVFLSFESIAKFSFNKAENFWISLLLAQEYLVNDKPVVMCGNYNIYHRPIDIYNLKRKKLALTAPIYCKAAKRTVIEMEGNISDHFPGDDKLRAINGIATHKLYISYPH